jgi:methionyl-tRNA formyltransferase
VTHPLHVLLLGMRCTFTLPPLRALLAAPEIDLRAVIVPARPLADAVGAGGRPALDATLNRTGIPLLEAPSLRRDAMTPILDRMGDEVLDAIVTACFPWRVPRWLRELPRLGAVNVHPSLLPAGRGPEPVFHALRTGQRRTGVTVHLLDRGWDTGPILTQAPFDIPDGLTLPAIETALAERGGALLVDTLRAMAAGRAAATLQDDKGATAAPTPTPHDLLLPTNLPAAWAARFAHAVTPVYTPLTVLVMATGEQIAVDAPLHCDSTGTLDAPMQHHADRVGIRFTPGVVWFHPAQGPSR